MSARGNKRSVVIHRQKTSISFEPAFWDALKFIAAQRQVPVSSLIASIDADRKQGNLSSARFGYLYWRKRAPRVWARPSVVGLSRYRSKQLGYC